MDFGLKIRSSPHSQLFKDRQHSDDQRGIPYGIRMARPKLYEVIKYISANQKKTRDCLVFPLPSWLLERLDDIAYTLKSHALLHDIRTFVFYILPFGSFVNLTYAFFDHVLCVPKWLNETRGK